MNSKKKQLNFEKKYLISKKRDKKFLMNLIKKEKKNLKNFLKKSLRLLKIM